MNPLALLVVTTLVNGQPVSAPISLHATTEDCRAELSTVNGMNMAARNLGISYVARCERTPNSDR